MKTGRFFDTNSLLIRLTGLVDLLGIPFKHLTSHIDHLLPADSPLDSRYSSLLLGIGLLYVADQVARQKRSAYLLAVGGLTLLIIVELVHFRNPFQLLLYSATLTSIIKDRRNYVVRSDSTSFRRALTTSLGLVLILGLFAGLLVGRIEGRDVDDRHGAVSTYSIIGRSLVGAPLPTGTSLSRHSQRIIDLLRVAAVGGLAIVGISLFQPLKLRRPAPAYHRRRARLLCEQYSQSSEDYLKLWPADKHYYFYQDSFLAYRVVSGIALVLDGATGKAADQGRLRRQFLEYARSNGWTVALVHADLIETEKWQRYGLQSIFIGSEAAVDVAEFLSQTSRDKHFRYVSNKATKDELAFELWQPPLTSGQLRELRQVSDAWLSGGHREYSFIMGYFSGSYLGQCQVGVLRQADQLVAYANLLPVFKPEAQSIDHMRALQGTSPVAMHFLLLRLIEAVHEQGAVTFNLGLSPLSKLEDQSVTNLGERLLPLVKVLGSRYYSFSGLEQFKGKFRPEWAPRYICYQGGPTRLPAIVTALNYAVTYRPGRSNHD